MKENTGKKVPNKKQDKYNKKVRKILFLSGLGMALFQLIASIVLMIMIGKVDVLPTDYIVLIDILLVLLCVVVAIFQRSYVVGIITKVLSLLLSIVFIAASIYINLTYSTINKISGVQYKTTSVCLYVLADSDVDCVQDLADSPVGILGELDRTNTDEALDDIKDTSGISLSTKEYQDPYSLAVALYDMEVEAILMNSSYVGMISGMDEEIDFSDFETKTKVVSSYEKNEEIDNSHNEDYLSNDEVITIYISGVDVYGEPTVNRNSDVNILCVINKKTHQILLLNTPRDYYVPTTVSGGVPDKLTHAGCYGIDSSVGTLEMLYGINIDYYLKVNFTGFTSIIDAVGGIDVYSEFDFVSHHGKYHFTQGMNYMDGQTALYFARERYAFPTGDNQRGKNQMAVINALIKKLASSELIMNYTNILNAVSASMITNMPYEEIGNLVKFQIDEAVNWDIVQYAVKGTGAYAKCYSLAFEVAVMLPDEATVNQAKEYLEAMHNNQYISVE